MEEKKQINFEEKEMNPSSGWGMLFLSLILYLASIGAFIAGGKPFLTETTDLQR